MWAVNSMFCLVFFCVLSVSFGVQNEVIRIVKKGVYGATVTENINKSCEYIFEYYNNQSINPTKVIVASTSANKNYPILVVAQQERRITSWQIPYVVNLDDGSVDYQLGGHILCPNAIEDVKKTPIQILQRSALSPRACSAPVITIKSSSPQNIDFNLFVDIQREFYIESGKSYKATVTASTPIYYYYSFLDFRNMANDSEAVLVSAESESPSCMIISIQNSTCPVFDMENNIKFDSYWQTMTLKAGMVVTKHDFPNGFYVVMVVKQNDKECSVNSPTTLQAIREKSVVIKITPSLTLKEHTDRALATLGVFVGIFLLCTLIGIGYLVRAIKQNEREVSVDEVDTAEGMINGQQQQQRWRQLLRKSSRSKKSTNYVWHVGIVALFYTLPVLQLVFTYQGILNVTGNEDLCYYNFLCAHPLGFISDFNHVFSNIGYVILGLLFLIITYIKELLERSTQDQEFGLPKPYGMFYALGFALIMEGVMSACYHVCPKSSNFQFDTSFMYVMCVLMIVNVYENRHATGDKRGYAVFGILAIATTLSVIGIYAGQKVWFWSIFAAIQICTCFALTWALEKNLIKMVFSRDGITKLTKIHICRIIMWIIGNLVNIGLAAYGIYSREGFGTYLLMVLIVNGLFYTIFYIFMKICYKEKILVITWIFIVLATVVWGGALYFFVSNVTSWETSPANSRVLNEKCKLVDYYDNHDIWHFLSSVALFFTFIVLLTLDEGLNEVLRSDITDFHGN